MCLLVKDPVSLVRICLVSLISWLEKDGAGHHRHCNLEP